MREPPMVIEKERGNRGQMEALKVPLIRLSRK